MDTSQLANLTNDVRMLPAEAAGRDRRLHRLADLHAATDARTALRNAAETADGQLATVLSSALVVWDDTRSDSWPVSEDVAARGALQAALSAPEFQPLVPGWVSELRGIAARRPDTGACTLATALQLWSWTADHFRTGQGSESEWAARAVDELAEVLCPLLAARCLVLEVAGKMPAESTRGRKADLCHVYAARTAASTSAACAELVFGYRRHLVWDSEGCDTCYGGDELDALEGLIPGIAVGARAATDVVESDGSHASKAGPCARFDGVETFTRLRSRLDGCLTGARLAKERAAAELARPTASTDPAPAGRQ
jgi:hypothetical protein